jgi:hypothetical protein
MDSQKEQAAERIKQANNILVTVSTNPSVDQLAACIGLTLALNKMGKHGTAVFSGGVPSTIEFLQPEKTIEKNTDSLRDFIIALDKSKADKLRYKVEDRVVKIFITPYKTSISEKDLEFSQGDFNVDVVLALGVHNQADLDQAITSHGRILHDATVITMNVKPGGELGGINWLDPNVSSLSELTVQLIDVLDKKLIDGQIATALLTGIVAETDRFSNAHTTPQTMSISAELMGAGANQQLVATKLEEPEPVAPPPPQPIAHQEPAQPKKDDDETKAPAEKQVDDGTLEISHDDKPKPVEPEPEADAPKPEPAPEEKLEPIAPQIHIDEHGSMKHLEPEEPLLPPKPEGPPSISHHSEPPKMVLEPPTLGGQLTASGTPGAFGEPNDGAGLPQLEMPSLAMPAQPAPMSPPTGPVVVPPNAPVEDELPSGGAAPADSFLVGPQPQPQAPLAPPVDGPQPFFPSPDETLTDIEKEVHSSHLADSVQTDAPEAPASTPFPASDSILPPIPASDGNAQPNPVFADNTDTQNIFQPPPPADANNAQQVDVNSARDAVAQAISGSTNPTLEPIQALNAQTVDLPMGNGNDQLAGGAGPSVVSPTDPLPMNQGAGDPGQQLAPLPGLAAQPSTQFDQSNFGIPNQNADPNAPPPVPPPMMPPTNPY